MGRSRASSPAANCLRIIACGKRSAANGEEEEEEDELEHQIPHHFHLQDQVQRKDTVDRRGWTFKKRSAKHQVLSSNIHSDIAPTVSREAPQTSVILSAEETNLPILEKISVARRADDVFPLSPVMKNSKTPDAFNPVTEGNEHLVSLPEKEVTVVQAAVRGSLAQRDFDNLKSIVKLQSVVRGHLVRKEAAGSLRCLHAIIKIQALVRAHLIRQSEEGLGIQKKLSERRSGDHQRSSFMEKQEQYLEATNGVVAEKMFGNVFAPKLLESTFNSKPINIVCDPENPTSGWVWMERWMSFSTRELARSRNQPSFESYQPEKSDAEDNFVNADEVAKLGHLSDPLSGNDVKVMDGVAVDASASMSEGDEDLITIETNGSGFQSSHVKETLGKEIDAGENLEFNDKESNAAENLELIRVEDDDSFFPSGRTEHTEIGFSSSPYSDSYHYEMDHTMEGLEPASVDDGSVVEGEIINHHEGSTPQLLVTEGEKFVIPSEQVVTPPSADVLPVIEESAIAVSDGVSPSSGPIASEESKSEVCDEPSSEVRIDDVIPADTFASHDQEHGAEVSVSSLDSAYELEKDGENSFDEKIEDHNSGGKGAHDEELNNYVVDNFASTQSTLEQPKVPEEDATEIPASAVDLESSNSESFDIKKEVEPVQDNQVDKSSQVGSPYSRQTVPESYGTPSSQISQMSVGDRDNKEQSGKMKLRRKTLSGNKKSPASQNQGSAEKNGLEQLTKDIKSGTRRNSFSSAKSDHSENHLPNYMQPTESARAKLLGSHSPKSSPDAQEKEGFLKKRQSLPVGNGKQGSPRVQRSSSEAQPGAKGSSTNSPHEREWRR